MTLKAHARDVRRAAIRRRFIRALDLPAMRAHQRLEAEGGA